MQIFLQKKMHPPIKAEKSAPKDAFFQSILQDELLLHQQLHNHLGAIGNRSTRTKDSGNAGFVEEVVVLRGDDTTGSDLVGSGDP